MRPRIRPSELAIPPPMKTPPERAIALGGVGLLAQMLSPADGGSLARLTCPDHLPWGLGITPPKFF